MSSAPRPDRQAPRDAKRIPLGDKLAAFTALVNGRDTTPVNGVERPLTDGQHRLKGAMIAEADEKNGGTTTRAAAEGKLPAAATRAVRDAHLCRTPFVRTPKRRRSHLRTLIALTSAAHRPPRSTNAGRRDARPAPRRARTGSAARGSARSGDSGSDGAPSDEDGDPAAVDPAGVAA